MRLLHWARAGFAAALLTVASIAHAAPPAAASQEEDEAKRDRPTFKPLLRINLRGQARTNAGNEPDPSAESWQVVEGVRAGAQASYRALTVVAQLQDVRAWGQGGTVSRNPFTGLHQGYIEVAGEANRAVSGFIRVGRQEIMYGSTRHFHRAPWDPAGRAFDAVRGRLNVGKASLELSYMLADRPRDFAVTVDDGTEVGMRGRGDHLAYGDLGYAFHPAAELHAAVIVQRLGAQAGDPTRDRFFVMPGGRLTGELAEGLDYEFEGWLQRGHERGLDMRAWMAAGAVGYVAPVRLVPGARLHYEIHSGSECTGDPSLGEACGNEQHRDFDQLYGARHRYRGWIDVTAGSNLRDLAASTFLSPIAKLKFTAVYHFLQLQAASGRWYQVSGESAWGAGWDPTNARNTLGHEVDLLVDYKPWKYLTVRPGYSVFLKGPAARRLLPPNAMHFVFLWFIAEL